MRGDTLAGYYGGYHTRITTMGIIRGATRITLNPIVLEVLCVALPGLQRLLERPVRDVSEIRGHFWAKLD